MFRADFALLCRSARSAAATLAMALIVVLAPAPAALAADVTINDANLLQAITETFAANAWTLSSPPQDTELGRAEFTDFEARDAGIADLTGLEAATSLVRLNLNRNEITDLAPLSGLTALEELYVGENQITSVAALTGLTNLVRLDIGIGFNPLEADEEFNPPATNTNFITDISPLATLINLEYLGLGGNNNLTNIGAIATMASLETLWLISNPIADFSVLASRATSLGSLFLIDVGLQNLDLINVALLTNLAFLGVGLNGDVTDLSALTTLDLTGFILLGMEGVSNFDFIESSTSPQLLFIVATPITALPDFSQVDSVGDIGLEGTAVVDITGLANATVGSLSVSDAPLSDLTGLDEVTSIGFINLEDTQVTDLQPIVDNEAIAGEVGIRIFNSPLSQDAVCIQIPAIQARLTGDGNIETDAFCGEPAVLTINIIGTGTTNIGTGTFDYQPGANIFLRALPIDGSGFAFSEWQGDIGSNNADQDGLNLTMDQDRTITAVFVSPADFTLTLNQSGPDPGYIEPGFGTFSYLSGNFATLSTGSNGDNGFFAGWTGDVESTLPFQNVLMDANKVVTANYTDNGFELQLNFFGSGGINGLGGGNYYFATGTVVPLDAFNFQGTQFDRWEGDIGAADPNSPSIEITMDQDRSIDIYFQEGNRSLTVAIGGAGSGSTNPSPGNYAYFDTDTAFVSATANVGSIFVEWQGDIGENSPTSPFLNLPMTQDRTVTAIFGPAFTLTVNSSGAGNTFPVPGVYSYAPNQVVGVTANPSSGSEFIEWQGDLGTADPNSAAISLTMDQNRSVTAVFTQFDWTVTVTQVGVGSVNQVGTFSFFDGDVLDLSASPVADSGYAFVGWSGSITSSELSTSVVVDSNKTITATFEENDDFLLTLASQGNGSTVPGAGAYAFSNGQEFQVAAQPGFGAEFDGWTGDIGEADPETNFLTLTMDQPRTVTANFVDVVTYDLTIATVGAGTTLPAAGQSYSFLEGQLALVTATATNGSGQSFVNWTGDIGDADPTNPVISLTMDQDRSITANFAEPDWILTVDALGAGTVDPVPGVYSYFDGETVVLEASEIGGNGYVFAGWDGDIADQDPAATEITVTMDQDRTITALFAPENSVLCQQTVPELAPYLSNEGTGYYIYDSFAGVSAPIGGLHWWGIQAVDPEGVEPFQPCTRLPDNFEVLFFEDSAGAPGPVVYSEVFNNMTGVNTGEMFFDYNIKEYTVTFAESFILETGWISIRGMDTEDCWFLWSSSNQGDNRTFQEVDGLNINEKVGDSAFCLIEGDEPAPSSHRADQNGDNDISLSELLRVIQFYNFGSYSCDDDNAPSEDGYVAGSDGPQDCAPHSSDYAPQDWDISLSELLRLIQFYNSVGYEACPDAIPPTEDGFCVVSS